LEHFIELSRFRRRLVSFERRIVAPALIDGEVIGPSDLLQHIDAQRADRVHRGAAVVFQRGRYSSDLGRRYFEIHHTIRCGRYRRRGLRQYGCSRQHQRETTASTERNIREPPQPTSIFKLRPSHFIRCEYTHVRLFVAVDVGAVVSVHAAELTRELQRRALEAAPAAKVTWVPADRLHLTVRFIGEVDDERVTKVCEALEPPLGVAPFGLTLTGVGAFPKGGSPRVLWVGVTDGREELLQVERAITSRLAPLGIPQEERGYNPHLTLARVREPAGLRTARLLEGLADRRIGAVRIDAITLFQSTLSPKGPAYTALLRIPCE
jgi:2'-5' RNA ligase